MINDLLEEIFNVCNTNIAIQVQSYGRVFFWDDMGKIQPEEDALCVFPRENDGGIENRIIKGLKQILAIAKENKNNS